MIDVSHKSHYSVNWQSPIDWGCALNKGLLARWQVVPHWTGGTTWRDLCNRAHGTLTNMDPATDWVRTNRRGGFGEVDIDGSNDRIATGATVITTPAFTISAWINPATFSGASCAAIAYQGTLASQVATRFYIADNVVTGLQTVGGGVAGGSLGFGTANAVTLNVWNHVAMVSLGTGTVNWYVNGKSAGTSTGMGTGTPAGSFFIGTWFDGGATRTMDGPMDDVRVFGVPKTEAEMYAIYNDSLDYSRQTLRRWGRNGKAATGGTGQIFLSSIFNSAIIRGAA